MSDTAATPSAAIPVLVWLEPEQVGLVRAVAAQGDLRIVAAGSPSRGRSREVAAALGEGTEPLDDLRSALTSFEGAAAAWLAAVGGAGDFGAAGPEGSSAGDLDAILAFRDRGGRVATMEPIPASVLELTGGGWRSDVELLRFVPRTRTSRPVMEAAEVLAAFGPVRTVAFEAWAGPGEGSLGARLLDAMDMILWLLGEPSTIDAAYMWPGGGGAGGGGVGNGNGASAALHKLPGESLRGLHGDMTLNCRFPDGRGATVVLSDCAGRWNRAVMLVGPGGRIRIYDDGFEWVGADGGRVDASRALGSVRAADPPAAAAGGGASPGRSAAVMADALSRYFTGREPAVAPLDDARVLTMAGAALLSARTGESESPATIARMAML